jgi:hypothetical protein
MKNEFRLFVSAADDTKKKPRKPPSPASLSPTESSVMLDSPFKTRPDPNQ